MASDIDFSYVNKIKRFKIKNQAKKFQNVDLLKLTKYNFSSLNDISKKNFQDAKSSTILINNIKFINELPVNQERESKNNNICKFPKLEKYFKHKEHNLIDKNTFEYTTNKEKSNIKISNDYSINSLGFDQSVKNVKYSLANATDLFVSKKFKIKPIFPIGLKKEKLSKSSISKNAINNLESCWTDVSKTLDTLPDSNSNLSNLNSKQKKSIYIKISKTNDFYEEEAEDLVTTISSRKNKEIEFNKPIFKSSSTNTNGNLYDLFKLKSQNSLDQLKHKNLDVIYVSKKNITKKLIKPKVISFSEKINPGRYEKKEVNCEFIHQSFNSFVRKQPIGKKYIKKEKKLNCK